MLIHMVVRRSEKGVGCGQKRLLYIIFLSLTLALHLSQDSFFCRISRDGEWRNSSSRSPGRIFVQMHLPCFLSSCMRNGWERMSSASLSLGTGRTFPVAHMRPKTRSSSEFSCLAVFLFTSAVVHMRPYTFGSTLL